MFIVSPEEALVEAVLFLLEPTTAPPLPVEPNDFSLATDSGRELGGKAAPANRIFNGHSSHSVRSERGHCYI